jgi:Lrp/AsnC family leucine-responsive transcriptional regulator
MEKTTSTDLDRVDRRLLQEIQRDARLTVAQLAERVALSTSPCWRRLKRLEEAGLVRGYHAQLDAAQLGWGVTAFVHIMLESHRAELGAKFEAAVRQIPQVVACHNVSGQYDFLLQVVARDLAGFGEFARSTIRALPGVKEMNSSFSLKEVKTGLALPVE